MEKTVSLLGFEISYYGILLAVSIWAVAWSVVLKAKRSDQDQDFYLGMLLVSLVTALLGARAYYVLFSWEYYSGHPDQIWRIWEGGLGVWGAILGGALGAFLFCKWKKADFGMAADTCAEGLVIGQMISFWGDYLNGDSFLYEFLWYLGLLLVLGWHRSRAKFHGESFAVYLTGCGAGQVWMEALHGDGLHLPGTGVPVTQVLSAALVLLCGAVILLRRRVAGRRAELARHRKEERLRNEIEREDTAGGDTNDAEGAGWQDTEPGGSEGLPEAERGAGQPDRGIPEPEEPAEENGQEIKE